MERKNYSGDSRATKYRRRKRRQKALRDLHSRIHSGYCRDNTEEQHASSPVNGQHRSSDSESSRSGDHSSVSDSNSDTQWNKTASTSHDTEEQSSSNLVDERDNSSDDSSSSVDNILASYSSNPDAVGNNANKLGDTAADYVDSCDEVYSSLSSSSHDLGPSVFERRHDCGNQPQFVETWNTRGSVSECEDEFSGGSSLYDGEGLESETSGPEEEVSEAGDAGSENHENPAIPGPDADLFHDFLDDESLSSNIRLFRNCSLREGILLILAVAARHNLTYEALIDVFTVINVMLGKKGQLPESKERLWRLLRVQSLGIRKHAYCSDCTRGLGDFSSLGDVVTCKCSEKQVLKKKVKYFTTLSLSMQLRQFLNTPNVIQRIKYRDETRKKINEDNIEDIFDGSSYHLLQEEGKPLSKRVVFSEDGELLSEEINMSYIFNTDGLLVFGSAKTEAWPIYVRLNEVHPNLRQRHVFLAGLWLEKSKPNMELFLEPFVNECNKLYTDGITWKPDNVREVVSRFVPALCSVDAMARHCILHMTSPAGYCGCTFCNHIGCYVGGSVKFPVPGSRIPDERTGHEGETIFIPEPTLRTHDGIFNAMVNHDTSEGVHGPSALINLRGFGLTNFSTDDLHPIFLGVTEFLTHIMLTTPGTGFYIGAPQTKALINERLSSIKTPSHISRKPRTIHEVALWKGSEWRNWLLYYCVPCLSGIIENRYLTHISLLSNAIFILSRDSISERDLENADACLKRFVHLFQVYHGPETMRFNVHVLEHLVACVRAWGPLPAHSTTYFESWNLKILQTITSPKGAQEQVITRYTIKKVLTGVPYMENVSDRVKEEIDNIMNSRRLKKGVQVGDAFASWKVGEREATEVERGKMEEEGYECENNRFVEYAKVKAKGVDWCSKKYGGDDTRSDNSHVYTHDDMFASIVSIVVFRSRGTETCGMFLNVYNSTGHVAEATHIVKVDSDNPVLVFIPLSQARNLTIKFSVAGQVFMMPMANHTDID